MTEAIEILTKMMIQAHFEKQYNKEEKIRLAIKVLKVVEANGWERVQKRDKQTKSESMVLQKIKPDHKKTELILEIWCSTIRNKTKESKKEQPGERLSNNGANKERRENKW